MDAGRSAYYCNRNRSVGSIGTARPRAFLRSRRLPPSFDQPLLVIPAQEADALFALYRHEAKPEEPVVASTFLFRYAHDRNLFWLDRLHNQPAPIWILGDTADRFPSWRVNLDKIDGDSAIRIEDYTLIDRRGRFVLMKKKR